MSHTLTPDEEAQLKAQEVANKGFKALVEHLNQQ